MSFYKLPKITGKQNKPPFGAKINWHHPLSQRLIGVWLFNEGGGFAIDNLLGIISQKSGTTDLPTYRGDSLYFNNAGLQLNTPIGNYPTNFSIVWKTTMDTVASYNQRIQINAGDWDGWTFSTEADSGGGAYCGTDVGTRMTPANIPAGTFVAGNTYTNCYTLGGGTGSFYKNGILIGSKAQNNAPAWSGLNLGIVGGGRINGTMYFIYIYNRTLIESEIRVLYAEPYQMFLHPLWDAYYVPAAAPPPTGGKSIFGYDSIFHAGGIIQT